jgi:hypothetical protein
LPGRLAAHILAQVSLVKRACALLCSCAPKGLDPLLTEYVMDAGRSAQLEAAAAFSAVPEKAERVDAPTQADAQPYVTDGVVFTS